MEIEIIERKQNKYARKYNWKRRGLDIAQATEMIASIKECQICGIYAKSLHIDHNHSTGKIRGVLCHKCNRALGFFNDDSSLLRKAGEYLDFNN